MTFGAPQMLWLLATLVPLLAGFFWWAWRKRQQLILQFISSRLLAQLRVGVSATRQKLRMGLLVAAVALAVVALARPEWGFIQEEARQRGLDIMVAIDTSNSMLAADVSPNRLTRAKLAALDLVQRAKTDRLGVIAFAGAAFLECPLTLDDAAFSASINSLDTKSISEGGTAIGEAIDEARDTFKKESGNHRVLVLFTDGEDEDSGAVDAAKKAGEEGIIILTVGIGTAEGEFLKIHDEHGQADYIRDENGKPVKSHLNEELLQQIAQAGKGFYVPLRGPKTVDTLYEQGIAPLPKSEYSARFFQHLRERFYWPLGVAMALLVVEMFLPDRKRRRPRSAAPVPANPTAVGQATVLLMLLLSLAFAPPARAGNPSGALREYNQGKFDDALRDYNQLLDKKSTDPRLHFNAGAAAYQGRKMDEAVKQFDEAAATSPDLLLQQRAYYNKGNALYRLGQLATEPSKRQEAWENALQSYTNALALNHQDPDAAYNRNFVQQQLEQLKQQQQQQSQQSKDKQKDNQEQKQDQKNQGGSQSDQQKDQNQSQPNKDSQSQDQSKDQSKKDQEQQKKDDQAQAQKQKDQADQKKNDEAKNQGADKPKDDAQEQAEQEAAMMAAGQMTPQQARQLLDQQKNDDQVLRLAPPNKNTSQMRTLKNW